MAEMSFHHVVAERTCGWVRSLVTLEELGVGLPLHHMDRSQPKLFEHLLWCLPREVFLVCLTAHQERPRTRRRDYFFQLVWERFGVLWDELEKLTRAGEVRVFLLRLLRPRTIPDNAAEEED